MNKLESTVLTQHVRIQKDVRIKPEDIISTFDSAQGEILSVATPELTEELIARSASTVGEYADLRGSGRSGRSKYNYDEINSFLSRVSGAISNPSATRGLLAEGQGYVGGVIVGGEGHQGIEIFGFGDLSTIDQDPIQQAMGGTFYPPMMWVKAIRAELARLSDSDLSLHQQLADLGLSQGSFLSEEGHLLGATGKMPSEHGWDTINRQQDLADHAAQEDIEAFRFSGWADFIALSTDRAHEPESTARSVIHRGGSLN